MAGFAINIKKEDLEKVKKTLIGVKKGYEKVIVRALNKTITGVETDSVREVSKIITPAKKYIRKTFRLKKANYTTLKAAVRSRNKGIPLIHYKAKQTIKGGVTAQIYQGGKRDAYPFCFITTMKSGHKGVFSRAKPPYKTHRSKKSPWKQFKEKYRLPIKEKFGPMVPDVMAKDKVMKPILKKAGDRLTKEIGVSLNFELSRL
jgi:hypothetical protein